ncbi:MAG: SGNH/GDSL hydrolase family protein [Actinomycetota bacterium]|jgi:lysophospholipase L1-like esterase|nr:SGNH/GDSL hydrolase family protein [Actinomycetota bacterium]
MAERRRILALGALGLPLALLGVLGVEAWMAANAEYLPDEPGYVLESRVAPTSGASDGPAVRLVVLGDSTAAGVGSPTLAESLPVQVAQRLADDLGRPVDVTGFGVSGARTVDVRDEQIPLLVDRRVDAVLIAIGSNDVTHATSPSAMAEQTRSMLRAARRNAGQAALVLGGIPLFGSADALAQPLRLLVDTYARVLRRVQRDAAAAEGARFVNIAVEASPRFAGVPEAMSSDGFHPAPVGYGFWADALAPALAAELGA